MEGHPRIVFVPFVCNWDKQQVENIKNVLHEYIGFDEFVMDPPGTARLLDYTTKSLPQSCTNNKTCELLKQYFLDGKEHTYEEADGIIRRMITSPAGSDLSWMKRSRETTTTHTQTEKNFGY